MFKGLIYVYSLVSVMFAIWLRYQQMTSLEYNQCLENLIKGSFEGLLYGMSLLFLVPYYLIQGWELRKLSDYPVFGEIFNY